MIQKIYSKLHLTLCTDTHYDVTDFLNYGMVKNTKKREYSENGTQLFYEIKNSHHVPL